MQCRLAAPAEGWEEDGLRLLETSFSPDCALMTFSVKPHVPPVLFIGHLKGRLQYALRSARLRVKFSRKVAMQSIGENDREDVEAYIANQIANESWADPRMVEVLATFTVNVGLPRSTRTAPTAGGTTPWRSSRKRSGGLVSNAAKQGSRERWRRRPETASRRQRKTCRECLAVLPRMLY